MVVLITVLVKRVELELELGFTGTLVEISVVFPDTVVVITVLVRTSELELELELGLTGTLVEISVGLPDTVVVITVLVKRTELEELVKLEELDVELGFTGTLVEIIVVFPETVWVITVLTKLVELLPGPLLTLDVEDLEVLVVEVGFEIVVLFEEIDIDPETRVLVDDELGCFVVLTPVPEIILDFDVELFDDVELRETVLFVFVDVGNPLTEPVPRDVVLLDPVPLIPVPLETGL